MLDDVKLTLTVYKMPACDEAINGSDKLRVDKHALATFMLRLFGKARPDFITFEEQWARPATGVDKDGKQIKTQGIASTFTFAEAYGAIQGAIYSAVAHQRSADSAYLPQIWSVSGRKWKGGFGLSSDKKEAVALATRLFPHCARYWQLAKNVSAAEASLIAYYGAVVFAGRQVKVTDAVPYNLEIIGFDPISVTENKRGRTAKRGS